MLKVLIVSPYLAPSYGGTSKSILELAKAMSRLNLKVDLVSTNARLEDKSSLQDWVQDGSLRIRYFSSWYRNDLIVSFRLLAWLAKNISKYDVVHTNTLFSPLISLTNFLCRSQKVPYLNTPHGMLEPWALANKVLKKKYYYRFVERPSLQKANAIHTLATPEQDKIRALGFNNTVTIPNGIIKNQYQSLPSSELFYQQYPHLKDKKLILFLGRIDPKKGLDLLAPAFAKAHDHFPNIHLIVAGPDSKNFLPTTKRFFADANCLDAVTFTGMIKGQSKLSALSAANIYIAPSYSEGFSMSILEGMAAGLPCIITDGCNFPEAKSNQVAHVVDIDSEAIAQALITCLEYPQQAQSMGQKARKFILENYTCKANARKMFQVYQNIHKPTDTNKQQLFSGEFLHT